MPDNSRLNTPETTPHSIPTNSATAPLLSCFPSEQYNHRFGGRGGNAALLLSAEYGVYVLATIVNLAYSI